MIGFKSKLANWLTVTVTIVAAAAVVQAMASSRPSQPDPTPSPHPTATSTEIATLAPTRTPMPTPTQIQTQPTPSITQVGGEPADQLVRCMASAGYRCNVRNEPGGAVIVAQVWSGDTLPLDAGYQGGDWWRVELPDGTLGYGSKDYFTRLEGK